MNPLKLLQCAEFHGANRLADKTSRWFWIPSLLFLLATAITLVMLTISRYKENPTYMVKIDKGFAVKRFPSVILCPEIALVKDKMDQFVTQLKYPLDMNQTEMREILPQLAAFYSPDMPYDVKKLMKVERLLDYNGITVEAAGKQLTVSCEEMLIKCRWMRTSLNCTDIFRMELTADGFCCVFNGRSLRREMEERDSSVKVTRTNNHWYTRWFGYTSGLMIAINQTQKPLNIDLTYKWIALQPSQHFVDSTINGTALNPGSEQWIAYFTKNFQIADEAKSLSPSLRKCMMITDELRYFPMYYKKYCLIEQEIANTLEKCGCVRTVHPKPPGAVRCRAEMVRCANQALLAYGDIAECPLACEEEYVHIETSSFVLDHTIIPIDSFYHDLNYDKVTVVRVLLQSRKQHTNERWSYYGYLDLFSQLGGMFNVFLGCSVLTLLALLQLGWHFARMQWRRTRPRPHRPAQHPTTQLNRYHST